MVRRKSAHVERNRQQNQRQRELEAAIHTTIETTQDDVSHNIVELIDEHEIEKDDTLGFQRPHPLFELRVHVGDLPLPWAMSDREAALWLTIPITTDSKMMETLHRLEPSFVNGDAITVSLHTPQNENIRDENVATVTLDDVFVDTCWSYKRGFLSLPSTVATLEINGRRDYHKWTYVLRLGIHWKNFIAFFIKPSMVGDMHEVMIWALYHSRSEEWTYPYKHEVQAMYQKYFTLEDKSSFRTVFDVHELYTRLNVSRQLSRETSTALKMGDDSSLLPTLRAYQQAAVTWMLEREQPTQNRSFHFVLPRCVRFGSIPELRYDLFYGQFVLEGGKLEPQEVNLMKVRGGILADEMGLGKTVEVISLILSHPAPPMLAAAYGSAPEENEAINVETDETNMDIHCICESTDECGQGWVQCDHCRTWHHQLCTGFDPNADVSIPFICFHCSSATLLSSVVDCKTTLIVSPEAIHAQWETELTRHVRPGALRVLKYYGVRALRRKLTGQPSSEWQLLATHGRVLAMYDVVLTTYEVLGTELHHIPTEEGIARRASTRSRRSGMSRIRQRGFIASPLLSLRFWRVCMDEAQVGVENARVQSALTVAKVAAINKWVVTGTPFSTQSLSDLFGTLSFLNVFPQGKEGLKQFQEQIESMYIRGATERVHDLLLWDGRCHTKEKDGGGLLWRTTKRDVLDQLQLPEQTTKVIWCRFSAVERHFYEEQERCVVAALKAEQQRREKEEGGQLHQEDERNEVDQQVGDHMWHHVLQLRQICCHPQVGRTMRSLSSAPGNSIKSRNRGRGRRQRGVLNMPTELGTGRSSNGFVLLTMADFLDELLITCRRDCEEAQRQVLAARNGQAAIALILDDSQGAVLNYVTSAEIIRRNWEEFRADLLPRLHVMIHLARCVRQVFQLPEVKLVNEVDNSVNVNPTKMSMIPKLTAIKQSISDINGTIATSDNLMEQVKLECEQLEQSTRVIRSYYLTNVEQLHTLALHHFDSSNAVNNRALYRRRQNGSNKHTVLCHSSAWWTHALTHIQSFGASFHFIDRVRARLLSHGTPWTQSFAARFRDVSGLSVSLVHELEILATKRAKVWLELRGMSSTTPSTMEAELSGNCKQCRDARTGPVCRHCKFYKVLEGYRQHLLGIDSNVSSVKGRGELSSNLYDISGDGENGDDLVLNTTSSSTSLIVDVFREIASYAKGLLRQGVAHATQDEPLSENALEEGIKNELELWSQLLREWTHGKKLFQAQHQRLGAVDELEMAQVQLRLRYEDEEVTSAADKLYKLEPYEVDTKMDGLVAEQVVAEHTLQQKQSQLRYLKHLQQHQKPASINTAMATPSNICVVCLEDMGIEHAVLPCAHTFCCGCAKRLTERSIRQKTIKCPTCRRMFSSDSSQIVRAVTTKSHKRELESEPPKQVQGNEGLTVKSGFSSKIDAMLRCVVSLARSNAALKALVFTQFQDMTTVVAAALQHNGVRCLVYKSKKQFHNVLQEFKRMPEPCVLVLPFKVGANGVNIIEATEVLLMEPLLNSSIEAQAINRVHRIGQMKKTRVYRFVVHDSVEERIYTLGEMKKQSHKNKKRKHDAIANQNGINEGMEDEWCGEDGDEDESLVISRKEKEKLTMRELLDLLGGANDGSLGGLSVPQNDARDECSDEIEAFWHQHVTYCGRIISRRDAKRLLERRYAAEKRAIAFEGDSSMNEVSDAWTRLGYDNVNLVVAYELVRLPKAIANDMMDTVESENAQHDIIATLYRARVEEEYQTWQQQTQANNKLIEECDDY